MPPDESAQLKIIFLKSFSTKSYVVGAQKNRLNEMVLLSTQNIYRYLNWCRYENNDNFTLKIINFNTIQLLTIEALDMIWYLPDSTNIDRVLLYNFSKQKKQQKTKSWLRIMSWTVLNFFFLHYD